MNPPSVFVAALAVHLGACTPAAFSMSDAAPPLVVRSGPIRQRVRGDALDLAALPAVGLEHGRDGGERYIAVQSEASLDPGTGPRRMSVRVAHAPLGWVTVGRSIAWRGGTGSWQGKVTVACSADQLGTWLAPARWMSAGPRSDGALAIDVRVAEGAFDGRRCEMVRRRVAQGTAVLVEPTVPVYAYRGCASACAASDADSVILVMPTLSAVVSDGVDGSDENADAPPETERLLMRGPFTLLRLPLHGAEPMSLVGRLRPDDVARFRAHLLLSPYGPSWPLDVTIELTPDPGAEGAVVSVFVSNAVEGSRFTREDTFEFLE